MTYHGGYYKVAAENIKKFHKINQLNMGMPKNLLLVRHGESEGNLARKKFEESNDENHYSEEFLAVHESQYALTALGIEQARNAGLWLLDNNFIYFDRMLVSNNVRAKQTAAYLDLPKAKWMEDYNLRERDGGLFNTITPSKRDVEYADMQKFYNSQPFLYRPPQGESIADVAQRIKVVLETLARECDGQNVIIVCHGHVIRTFKIILERLSLEESNDYLITAEEWGRVPNCSILHYTRENPFDSNQGLSGRFDWARMVRPGGGGKLEDKFMPIIRKKYTNEELLASAKKQRGI